MCVLPSFAPLVHIKTTVQSRQDAFDPANFHRSRYPVKIDHSPDLNFHLTTCETDNLSEISVNLHSLVFYPDSVFFLRFL